MTSVIEPSAVPSPFLTWREGNIGLNPSYLFTPSNVPGVGENFLSPCWQRREAHPVLSNTCAGHLNKRLWTTLQPALVPRSRCNGYIVAFTGDVGRLLVPLRHTPRFVHVYPPGPRSLLRGVSRPWCDLGSSTLTIGQSPTKAYSFHFQLGHTDTSCHHRACHPICYLCPHLPPD
ncbi:hypothetical protein BJV78DRAFT_756156 [Lactifluus subvellereus]|nr:hypothetical protein BJV78DRAFT_756156 [Lactifluus subvellereus]